MPNDLPFTVLLPARIRHTPPWACAVLALLTALGLRQMREHRVSRARVSIAPLLLPAYSLYGAPSAFGWRAPVLLGWAAGMAGALAANRRLRWPRQVRPAADGGFVVGASAWPLVLMLAVFAQRYVATVALVLHPAWRNAGLFAGPMALAWGLFSGLFLARALRVLSTARGAVLQARLG